ncbi:hypothetical protein HETIRDRAFT_446181 [Heterobasidion irregulare TC 32-1]|uniref:NADH:flavin oxidoreductase/NADH oxidase N-terminal domain-containing protein n=1 Tax=Heterobasidion irregulare (strain TC 32-1) TaxID=747525 RepID=W4JY79_HETIT|nr:uncharacterized protein HETIRDRAFT_446181 [Heterobasidion irregulare TC 32-1]ETW78409.1 hypothetical protein HETIRDRAFT_446181 [Heterobasidion irregulare TC 32-1]
MSSPSPQLFQPLTVGNLVLQHRVVMAPLTRFRANAQHIHTDIAVKYYTQRASIPGTLIISEATFIAPQAGGYANVPGIWSDEQIASWKKVTDAIHAKGSFIYIQLWALGRAADPAQLVLEDSSFQAVSSGNIRMGGREAAPRPLTVDEIKEYVQFYATAASNAVHKAGFDGVEIHNANGYLPDQFLQDVSNNRTDEYGGSIENRARFGLEVIDAVTKAVGEKIVGIRFSPWSEFQDMGMKDPIPTFSHMIETIRDRYPDFGYIHLVEPRINAAVDIEVKQGQTNEVFRKLWGSKVYLTAGGYKKEDALKAAETDNTLVVFGRYFISNPDLVLRLKEDIPLTMYDRNAFYAHTVPEGYIDWPFANEMEAAVA